MKLNYLDNGRVYRYDSRDPSMLTYTIVSDQGAVTFVNVHEGGEHRLNGPSSIWPNGHVMYSIFGLVHRTDGPAIIGPQNNVTYRVAGTTLSPDAFFMKYGVL